MDADLSSEQGVMSAEGNGLGSSCWDRCVHWGDLITRTEPKRSQMMRSNHLPNGNGTHLVNGNHIGNGNYVPNGNHLGNGKIKANGHVQSE